MGTEDIEFLAKRKDVGTALFKSGRLTLALHRYMDVEEYFTRCNINDLEEEENRVKAKELKKSCILNQAAVFMKLKYPTDVINCCTAVLEMENDNLKAYYRRAQAYYEIEYIEECIADCKRVVEIDPQNREARALLKQAVADRKKVDTEDTSLFSSMCKDIGKGSIPEPYKKPKGKL